MTRCYFYLENKSHKDIKCVGQRGDDSSHEVNCKITAMNGNSVLVGSMGCPRDGQSHQWGWLYFKAYSLDDEDFAKYFTIYAKFRHSGDIIDVGADWASMSRDSDKPENAVTLDHGNGTKPFHIGGPIGYIDWAPDYSNLGPQDHTDSPIVKFVYTGKQV